MKYELKRLDIWSVAKMSFVLGGALGLFAGTFFWMFAGLISQISALSGSSGGMDDMGSMGIIMPVLLAGMYGVMMMIMNVIMAVIYNLFASLVGGLQVTLEVEPVVTYTQQPAPVAYAAPQPQAPQPPPPSPPPPASSAPPSAPGPPSPPPGTDG